MRKALKIAGFTLGGVILLIASYLGILMYPGVLFANHINYKNFRVHSEAVIGPEQVRRVLDDVDAALMTSEINDPTITHDILLGHDNKAFEIIQDIAWWIFTGSGRPVLTYNRAGPAQISQVISFRTPDFERDLLVHPEARFDMGMSHDFIHEAVHSLVTAQVGGERNFSLPEWKREGYPEYVASSIRIFSDPSYELGSSVERILAEDLSWMPGTDGSSTRLGCTLRSTIQDEAGHWRRTCYYIGRVLVEYLLDIKGLTVEELMGSSISPTETFQELVAAYRAGQL